MTTYYMLSSSSEIGYWEQCEATEYADCWIKARFGHIYNIDEEGHALLVEGNGVTVP